MSSFDRIVLRAAETNTLVSVLLELTYRCNLDCYFCYNDLGKKGELLPTSRYLSVLEELRNLGVMTLTLSGGEPLAHPGFWKIGRRASELAFSTRIKTNGHAVDGSVSERLFEEVRPFLVEVSLHGATAETHDRQTRVPGSFDRLLRNLSAMRSAGLNLKLNVTLTAWNVDQIEGMYGIADELGVPIMANFTVTPRDDGDRTPLSIAPDREAMRRAAEFMLLRAESAEASTGTDPTDEIPAPSDGPVTFKNCGVGSSTLTVDPYGDVFPCIQWREPLGNVHERSLREIWHGNPDLEGVREANLAAGRMVASLGPAGRAMGFCPALARSETGSPTGIYEAALRRAEAFQRPIEIEFEKPAAAVVSTTARPAHTDLLPPLEA